MHVPSPSAEKDRARCGESRLPSWCRAVARITVAGFFLTGTLLADEGVGVTWVCPNETGGGIAGLTWDTGRMRRMVNGDMGLSDAAYDCPSVVLSSLEGGRYELKVVMERYAQVQLSPSSRVMRVQPRKRAALAGMISALPKTCRLDMVGLPVSDGIVVRDESPYHQVLFESEPITELDYERDGAGCASDGVPVRSADKGLFLNKAVFLSRRKCGLLVLSLSPVGSPESVSPLCVLNFDIEGTTVLMASRFAACGGGRPYVHAYFDRNRNLVVYCGKDGWEKTVTLAAEWLVGMCETVAQSYDPTGQEAMGTPSNFMMSSEGGGALMLRTREALCRFEALDVVCGRDSQGRLTLPLDVRCVSSAGENCEWEFTRTGVGEAVRSRGRAHRDAPRREPLSSRDVDGVKVSVAKRGDGRTEVEISCGGNSSQSVCVYRRKGSSWYRVLPCGDSPRINVSNLGSFAAGEDMRVFDEFVPVTLWMPDPVAPNAERARRIVLVTRHSKTGGLSHAVYREADGLWVLAQIVYWGERGVDSSGNWSSLRALGSASELCESLFPFRGTERKSSCKLLGRAGELETGTGIVRGVWEASDGVRAWFALEGPKDGVVAAAVSTDEASAVCPGSVPDRVSGAGPNECLFLENDGRVRWQPFCGTPGK